ncbi:hypothetical protein THIOKS12540049 [Thiocapsa sp. KS1]|nr:hypothetical protein THIOKS12540049 [Thiocapsa sp. KS1]
MYSDSGRIRLQVVDPGDAAASRRSRSALPAHDMNEARTLSAIRASAEPPRRRLTAARTVHLHLQALALLLRLQLHQLTLHPRPAGPTVRHRTRPVTGHQPILPTGRVDGAILLLKKLAVTDRLVPLERLLPRRLGGRQLAGLLSRRPLILLQSQPAGGGPLGLNPLCTHRVRLGRGRIDHPKCCDDDKETGRLSRISHRYGAETAFARLKSVHGSPPIIRLNRLATS